MGTEIKIEDWTYGPSEEERILATNLREYGNYMVIRKVGKLLDRYRTVLNQVSKVSNHSVKIELLKMVRSKYLGRVDSFALPPNIDSFLRNVLTIHYREVLKD
jgi:hypothetical protein